MESENTLLKDSKPNNNSGYAFKNVSIDKNPVNNNIQELNYTSIIKTIERKE